MEEATAARAVALAAATRWGRRTRQTLIGLQLQWLDDFRSSRPNRVESTDSLRGRIRELEGECKKLSMDAKLKEEQIRDLEGKCQVSRSQRTPTITGTD